LNVVESQVFFTGQEPQASQPISLEPTLSSGQTPATGDASAKRVTAFASKAILICGRYDIEQGEETMHQLECGLSTDDTCRSTSHWAAAARNVLTFRRRRPAPRIREHSPRTSIDGGNCRPRSTPCAPTGSVRQLTDAAGALAGADRVFGIVQGCPSSDMMLCLSGTSPTEN
jgi:hypothetical protein